MDRETAKRLAPVIKAYAEGKTIQCLSGGKDKTWNDVECPDFYPLFDYRIKPEWSDLKKGDICLVRNGYTGTWFIRVFSSVVKKCFKTLERTVTENHEPMTELWEECKPYTIE